MMKKLLLILVLLSLSSIFVLAIDCCVTDQGECLSDFGESQCTSGDYIQSSCSAVEEATIQGTTYYYPCNIGCCYASESAANYEDWNAKPEEDLTMIKIACELVQGDNYYFNETCSMNSGDNPSYDEKLIKLTGTITDPDGNLLKGIDVVLPIPGGSYNAITDESGNYEIQDISVPIIDDVIVPWTAYVYVYSETCGEIETAELTFEDTDLVQDFVIDCDSSCVQTTNDITSFEVTSDAQIIIKLDFDNQCDSSIKIKKETINDGNTINTQILSMTSDTLIIDAIEPNTEYCFTPIIVYGASQIQYDEKRRCVTTSDEACIGEAQAFCINNQKYVCKDGNINMNDPQCEGDSVCFEDNGVVDCIVPPKCNYCNGLFGIFASLADDLDLKIPWSSGDLPCNNNEVQKYCVKDKKEELLHDTYVSCFDINNCEDYLLEENCGADSCNIEKNCSWEVLSEPLGLGFCKDIDNPDCESCDKLGHCDSALCSKIDDSCYFDTDDERSFNYNDITQLNEYINYDVCLPKEKMACAFYNNQEDCERDPLDFRVCEWHSDTKWCVANADHGEYFVNDAFDDAFESDVYDNVDNERKLFTLNDNVAPTTIINIPGVNNTIGLHQLNSITYYINDNFYTENEIKEFGKTYFCMGEGCTPNLELNNLLGPEMEVGETEKYVLRFSSIDPSGNIEEPKEEVLTITNYGIPYLITVGIE